MPGPRGALRAVALVLVATLFGAALTSRTALAEEEAISGSVWDSGYDISRGAHYAFTGGTIALNRDISRDGFHVRVYGSIVGYDLDPGDGFGSQVDLMLGYRMIRAGVDAGLYVGVDYQNFDLDPDDPTAEVRGTEWGLKVAADLETPREDVPVYYSLEGEYSTAFRTYWARARFGINRGEFTFGPEAAVLGDVSFDAQRLGAFAIFDWRPSLRLNPVEVTLHAGHQFISSGADGEVGGVGGGEGAYGGITFRVLF